MGRARGGPQAAAGAAAPTRRAGGTPAELLGAVPGGNGAPASASTRSEPLAPDGPPIRSARGVALYRADSTDKSLCVPASAASPDGLPAYPQVPRQGMSRLDGALWERLVRRGRVYRIEDLRRGLWQAAVGTRALGGQGKDGPISEARLREELHAWAHEAMVPAGSDVPLPGSERERGFGILRDRQACRDYVRHLRGRADAQSASLRALDARAPLWFEADADARAAWVVPEAAPERVTALMAVLSDGEWHKGRELAQAAWGQEVSEASAEGVAPEAAVDRRVGAVRALVARMRTAGVPVVASSSHGYRLAQHPGDLQTYLAGEEGRVDAVREHAQQIERAGARWYPDAENPEEVEAARRWRSQIGRSPTAPATLRRQERMRAAHQRTDRQRQEARERAAEHERELMASPMWERVRVKHMAGQPLTAAERDFQQALRAERRTKKSGRAPAAKRGAVPRPAPKSSPGDAAVPPPPW